MADCIQKKKTLFLAIFGRFFVVLLRGMIKKKNQKKFFKLHKNNLQRDT